MLRETKTFLEDQDQNLKYLGLVGFSSMMQFSKSIVANHRALILGCLQDPDVTVRLRALNLLCGMITKQNIVEVTQKLLKHATLFDDVYRDAVIGRVLAICSFNNYCYISNFEWYVGILIRLLDNSAMSHGGVIGAQLTDICTRVSSVRCFAVSEVARMLVDERMASSRSKLESGRIKVLMAAAFIVGEYSEMLGLEKDSCETDEKFIRSTTMHRELLATLLCIRGHDLPQTLQSGFIHSATKVILALNLKDEYGIRCAEDIIDAVMPLVVHFATSVHVEIRERAIMLIKLLNSIMDPTIGCGITGSFFEKMKCIYDSHLNVVNKNAQGVVPIPPMLDLYDWIDTGEEHLVKMTKCVSEGRIMFHPKAESSVSPTPFSVSLSDSTNRNEWGFLHDVDEKSLQNTNGKDADTV